MSRARPFLATLIIVTCQCGAALANAAPGDLLWSSVPLKGMHLRLVSPKPDGVSEDLYFGDGTLAIDSCRNGVCTGPATVWKIENNRLKIGYSASTGNILVKYTAEQLVIRSPTGEIDTYSIVQK